MATLSTAKALAMGFAVSQQTGKLTDGATASGYALWVQSITNTLPKWAALEGKRARVFLTEAQKSEMRTWIENQVKKSFTEKSKPSLETDIGTVIGGAGTKWGIIGGSALLVAGALAMKFTDIF